MNETFTQYLVESEGHENWQAFSRELIAQRQIVNVVTVISSDGKVRVMINYYGPALTSDILYAWWPEGAPHFMCMGGRWAPIGEAPVLNVVKAANDD